MEFKSPAMAKKIKINSVEVGKIKSTIGQNKGKTEKEKLFEIWKLNKKFNKKETSEILGVSRVTVSNWVKEFESVKESVKQNDTTLHLNKDLYY